MKILTNIFLLYTIILVLSLCYVLNTDTIKNKSFVITYLIQELNQRYK